MAGFQLRRGFGVASQRFDELGVRDERVHRRDRDACVGEFGSCHGGESLLRPALDAPYAAEPGNAEKVIPELTLTMLPEPCFRMMGSTACMVTRGATRLSSRMARKSSGSISSSGACSP